MDVGSNLWDTLYGCENIYLSQSIQGAYKKLLEVSHDCFEAILILRVWKMVNQTLPYFQLII